MSHTVSDRHTLSERYLLLCRTFTFFAKAGHVAGTRLAGRTRRARECLGRIIFLSLPPCFFVFFLVGNMHVMHTCSCIYESMNDEY